MLLQIPSVDNILNIFKSLPTSKEKSPYIPRKISFNGSESLVIFKPQIQLLISFWLLVTELLLIISLLLLNLIFLHFSMAFAKEDQLKRMFAMPFRVALALRPHILILVKHLIWLLLNFRPLASLRTYWNGWDLIFIIDNSGFTSSLRMYFPLCLVTLKAAA